MPTVTATIEIDCPDGYEPVAYRPPERELHLNRADELMTGSNAYCRLIVRPVWQPAAWMPKGAWLYPAGDYWFFSLVKPRQWNGGVDWGSESPWDAVKLAVQSGETFVPPPTREPVQIK